MTRRLSAIALLLVLAGGAFAGEPAKDARDSKGQGPKGQACRMEQQCRWENFKKICTWVKVCR